jgi:hypothetical protein
MTSKNIPLALMSADPENGVQNGDSFGPIKSDLDGVLYTLNYRGNPQTAFNPILDNLQQFDIFGFDVRTFGFGFNGSTFDRLRTLDDSTATIAAQTIGLQGVVNKNTHLIGGSTLSELSEGNSNQLILALAARTASVNSANQKNRNLRGGHIIISVSAITAAPSVVFTVQGLDSSNGVTSTYYTILTSAAITAVGTTVLRIYPALTAAANLVANDVLPRVWRVVATHANSDSITYSVGFNGIV